MCSVESYGRLRLKRDGTGWRTGGEVKGKLANGVCSQYSSHYLGIGVFSITTADAHTSAASSRLNWRPCRFKLTRPFRRKTKFGFCACAITFQTQSTMRPVLDGPWAQRKTVLSGKRLQPLRSKLKVAILNGTFWQLGKNFRPVHFCYRQVSPYCIMILIIKTVIPGAERVLLIALKYVDLKRGVFPTPLGITP